MDNVCIPSGRSVEVYDLLSSHDPWRSKTIRFCGLRTPISTQKVCGFKMDFYLGENFMSPFLSGEFCTQVSHPNSFKEIKVEPEEAVIGSEQDFRIEMNLNSSLSILNKIIKIRIPGSLNLNKGKVSDSFHLSLFIFL